MWLGCRACLNDSEYFHNLNVIPAGSAGIQTTGKWSATAIHGHWVPAIPAGTMSDP
jgi:hypothetical protein